MRKRTRRLVGGGLGFLGLYLVANVLYAVKSIEGVDLDPFGDRSHHGSWFPLGDAIYRSYGRAGGSDIPGGIPSESVLDSTTRLGILIESFAEPRVEPLGPETVDWARRVRANGGRIAPRTLAAVDAFVRGCQRDGTWSRLSRVNLFAGEDLRACLVPLLTVSGRPTDLATGFVEGDYTERGGLQGGGGHYLRTGVRQSDFDVSDRHLSVVECAKATRKFSASIGTDGDGTAANIRFWTLTTGDWADQYAAKWNREVAAAAYPGTGGVMVGSCTGRGLVLYRDSEAVGGSGVVGIETSPFEVYVFALDRNGTPGDPTDARLGGYTLGRGLSPSEARALSVRLAVFEAAIGRR